MNRKIVGAIVASGIALFTWGSPAAAQNFPTRPITLVVPQPPGGATDISIRALAAASEKHLGQTFVIENRAGVGATLGTTQMAATAKPDGYTVSATSGSIFRLPFISKTTFDPAKDLTYIIGVSGFVFGIVVRNDAPWNSLQELLADAKANPGKINYSSSGPGSNAHVAMEQIARQQGIKWTHIPYKGNAETNSALLGGHIDAVADGSGWASLVNEHKFRLLVTFGAERTKSWPAVPILREVGIDMVVDGAYGISGPRGMDPKIVTILHDAFKKGLEEPSFIAALEKLDQRVIYMSPEVYRGCARKKIEEEKRIAGELGLREQ
jgi:tripartite-type tricarboxylate transporter receptor subunit TctC